MLKNKSQVSMFIVIGLILIIVTAFLLFNSKFEFFQSYENRVKGQVSQVVETCALESLNNGVFLLGFQGGYIDVREEVEINPNKHIDLGIRIPNWDSETGSIPTIRSMEVELDNFILENSFSCIEEGLEDLGSSLEIEYDDNLEVESQINKESVGVAIDFNVRFNDKNSEGKVTVDKYFVEIEDLRLGDLYDLAIEIFNQEERDNFFEELVLEQIYTASDYSSRNSMPSEGMYFSCSFIPWTVDQLKRNLANLNNNNFKYLQFEGTYPKDYLFELNSIGVNSQKYFRSNQVGYVQEIDNVKNSFKNYEVDVFMPSTEITGNEGYLQRYPYREFEVSPSSGSIVKPIKVDVDAGINIPIPCVQLYHHVYTLDYDLIVKLKDNNENSGNYFFQFPLRVNIENNNPKQKVPSLIVSEAQTFNSETYCSEESKQYPLEIYTIDDSNDNLISDANISYKCVGVTCDMGQTDIRSGVLSVDFPYCVGGKVIVEKQGYHLSEEFIDVTDESLLERENPVYYNVRMIPKIGFKMDANDFLLINKDTAQGKRVVDKSDGQIYISFSNDAYDFESEVLFPNEGYLDTLEFLEKDGVSYNVSVIYMDEDYNLKGILEMEDWTPDLIDIKRANRVEIYIPYTESGIDENNYQSFYNFMTSAVSYDYTINDLGINIE